MNVWLEYLGFNESSEREVEEDIREVFPDVFIAVLLVALIVETIDLVDFTILVVASQDCHAVFIADFQREDQRNSFDGIRTAIHVVSHEKVIGILMSQQIKIEGD